MHSIGVLALRLARGLGYAQKRYSYAGVSVDADTEGERHHEIGCGPVLFPWSCIGGMERAGSTYLYSCQQGTPNPQHDSPSTFVITRQWANGIVGQKASK